MLTAGDHVSNFDPWAVLCGISNNQMRVNDAVYLKLSISVWHAWFMCSMRQCSFPDWKLYLVFWHGVKYKTWDYQALPPFEQRTYNNEKGAKSQRIQATVLIVRIQNMLLNEMTLNNNQIFLWTDSTIVLAFIQNESRRFKTFVANCVAEIKDD